MLYKHLFLIFLDSLLHGLVAYLDDFINKTVTREIFFIGSGSGFHGGRPGR